ncbi:MAG: DUF177 domain-containing protein [Alphaproteobacteria bacterium]|nr:DUF177 domain-containing protein [Alphaproteobacteria bacterium]
MPSFRADLPAQPWAEIMQEFSYPIEMSDIGSGGRSFEFAADDGQRVALGARLGLQDVLKFAVSGDVCTLDDGRTLLVRGKFSAVVVQNCVVTLDPVESSLEDTFELRYIPAADWTAEMQREIEVSPDESDVEPLEGSSIDLGTVVVEYLALALDPYPRRSGVEFTFDAAPGDEQGPFAGLAKLRNKV